MTLPCSTREAVRLPLVVVGGGAAGLMAAIGAADAGGSPLVIEAGPRCGRKILISGGSRCNLTHEGPPADILKGFGDGARFLRAATWAFPPEAVRQWFAAYGVPTYAQDDGCVFPTSDKAADVAAALTGELKRLNVPVHTRRRVVSMGRVTEGFIIRTAEGNYCAERVVLATGGCSYPSTGSTGDGWTLACALGHRIVRPRPALIPLETAEPWVAELAGVSLEDVELTAWGREKNEKNVKCRGDLLLAHWGISGPVTLAVSWRIAGWPAEPPRPIGVTVDVAPALDEAALDAQLRRRIAKHPKRHWPKLVTGWMPTALVETVARHLGPPPGCPAGELSKAMRRDIVKRLKALPLTVTRPRPIEHAIAVRGGVDRDEIDPATMQSRLCEGLFFAGEMIDVDGDCGGYNLQIAWSTGRLAGASAAGRKN